MRLSGLFTVFGCVAAITPSAYSQAPSPSPSAGQVTVTRVIQEVDSALARLKTAIDDKTIALPPFKSATLTLQTTVSKQAGGGFSFLIFSFGKKWTKEQSNSLEIVLTPPAQNVGASTISQDLADAIMSAAKGIAGAGSSLKAKSITAEVSFTVTEDTNGSGKFTIAPIDINFSGDLTNKAIQKVAIAFGDAGAH